MSLNTEICKKVRELVTDFQALKAAQSDDIPVKYNLTVSICVDGEEGFYREKEEKEGDVTPENINVFIALVDPADDEVGITMSRSWAELSGYGLSRAIDEFLGLNSMDMTLKIFVIGQTQDERDDIWAHLTEYMSDTGKLTGVRYAAEIKDRSFEATSNWDAADALAYKYDGCIVVRSKFSRATLEKFEENDMKFNTTCELPNFAIQC